MRKKGSSDSYFCGDDGGNDILLVVCPQTMNIFKNKYLQVTQLWMSNMFLETDKKFGILIILSEQH